MSYTIIQFTPQVESTGTDVADCDEIGTASRANASAHYRTRVHDVRLMTGEKRCLVANFNGAFGSARTISSATWRCDNPTIGAMSNARIQSDSRSSAVDLTARWIGETFIRCEATLDNDEVYIQPFHIDVSGDSLFQATGTAGSRELTVTA
jgi:hypothetical protein